MKQNKRWYDVHPKLGTSLDKLKDMKPPRRKTVITGILAILRQMCPGLMEQCVMDFPLNILKRRWYDKDPYLWLTFNGLRSAEKNVLKKVTEYLRKNT